MLIEASAPVKNRVHFEPEFVDMGNGYFALVSGDQILASVPAQVAHPLGPPTVTGTSITVDTMLKQPTASPA
jgi:phosphohistidine swiveling domain-containing protein